MQIKKIKITGLYGYINKIIDFNSDLTMLVGINGSGKTSILNILNWILKPSIHNLCITEFKAIVLNFNIGEKEYEIICKHNINTFTYTIKEDNIKYNPLTVQILTKPKDIRNDEDLNNIIRSYSGLSPDAKEKATWDLLMSLPKPTIIGLDRNIFTDETEGFFEETKIKTKNSRKTPIQRVKEIVNTEYRRRKNSILNLTNDLKNYLMLSTFEGSITMESFQSGIKHKLNVHQIEAAQKRVNDYFREFEKKILTSQEQEKITKYFEQLKDLVHRYDSEDSNETIRILYGLNASQFIKVNRLLKEFDKFETNSTNALKKIDDFIKTLNFFLKDASKQLLFKEDTSELTYNTLTKDKKIATRYNDISFLSSGEQQLLILFSYIAFNSQDGRIFIIDEPELSLHIKWQEDFLYYLDKITPPSVQLILATHSPVLAGKRKEKTKLLLPYN